jgi:pimeloyl-ACP methyl ester carboxylesterase
VPGPFEQLAFEAIPETPRKPHDYAATTARELTHDSRPFGRIAIHFREHGSGPPLLLLHGLMTTSYSWRYVVKELGERFRVIAPDMPGCGKSGKPEARYDAASLAAWVSEFVDAAEIRGCVAIGNSLGGFVMMRAVLDDPSLVARLVNMHSPAFPEARYFALHAALAIPGVRGLLARRIQKDPLRWAHAKVHYSDETLKSLEEAHAYGDPLATPEGVRAFIGYLAGAVAPHGFARLVDDLAEREFPVPLQLLYAKEDPLVRPENGARLAKLVPKAELVWLDRSSHFAHVDTPREVLDAVVPFLEGVKSSAARR